MAKFNIERIREIGLLVKELAVGLTDLTFGSNFKSFEHSVTISGTSQTGIRNQLNFIPTRYIIVEQTGNGLVTKGASDWTTDFVYLHNNGSVAVTIKVIFFR